MHGHHPDPAALAVGLAFDDNLVTVQPDQKAGQAGHLGAFIGQGLRQQFVDAILGLGPQSRHQPPPPVMPGQHPFEQVEGAQEVGPVAQVGEHG